MAGDGPAILAGRLDAASRRSVWYLKRRLWLSRPFSRNARHRLLILSVDERIPQSQVHPFHLYSRPAADRFGTEIREIPVTRYLSADHPGLRDAGTVCFQTQFSISPGELAELLATIRTRNPGARLVYLDWFAPTDLRLAERLDPHVDLYVKKHILADRALYGGETLGDTNLTDYYSRRFGIDLPPTRFAIPAGFLDKLILGPSFATAQFLQPALRRPTPPPPAPRPIDLHARIAIGGTSWYQAMRGESAEAVSNLHGVTTAAGAGVGLIRYLRELRHSKICFSPFGYGEVCWRDYEAVANGAVLLKPDMSHIRTDPDIFRPHETYVPLRWDLADFQQTVTALLRDEALRARIARQAFAVLHDYLASDRFVDQMRAVLAPPGQALPQPAGRSS